MNQQELKKLIEEILESINNTEYISPKEAGKRLGGVHPTTIRVWCREGFGPNKERIPYTKFGKIIRIKTRDFQKFCQKYEV
jgi:hypothetical protein